MTSSPYRRRLLAAVTMAVLVALPGVAAAAPTIDPSAPTPTTPYPGGPPEGRSPDGSVVGGDALAARGTLLPEGVAAPPREVTARGWLVADLDSGDVLAARDPHGRYYPASTLKTLTLLALHGEIDSATVVTGTAEDAAVEGTKVGLVPGGKYSVPLLFQAMMMASGNDAAWALARAAGGPEHTLELMNRTASQLQAYDTLAGTPSGLDVAGQSTSAYDLALFMRQIIDAPDLLAIMQTPTAMMPAVPPRYAAYQIQNQNPLLSSYPGMLAGKNGFTDAARHTYAAAAERDGRRLVVTLMQGEQEPVRMTEQVTRLLDWGFALPAGLPPVGALVAPRPPGDAAPTPTVGPAPVPAATLRPGATQVVAAAPASDQQPAEAPAPVLLIGLAVGSAAGLVLLVRRPRRKH